LLRIDHIFVSPNFKPIKVDAWNTTDTQMASDNLPVIADLVLNLDDDIH